MQIATYNSHLGLLRSERCLLDTTQLTRHVVRPTSLCHHLSRVAWFRNGFTNEKWSLSIPSGATLLLQRDSLFKPVVRFYRERVAPPFRISVDAPFIQKFLERHGH